MKFRITAKDFLMFVLFCILLFYLCCIGIVNFSTFAKTGEFAGLNPFRAFSSEFFAGTIILFLGVLIVIFTSVSSYIFSKEKGKGLGLLFGEKEEKGYNRWAEEKEIKTDKDVEKIMVVDHETKAAGMPLINNGKEMWVDNGEYHNLVIGSTGSGKTETIVKPMVNLLAKKGESMIIMDPKGEIYQYSADYLKQRGYNIKVLNFRDPQMGNAWNPLTLPYQYMKAGNTDKMTELLDDVALNILYDPSNKSDGGFWEKSAADYFSGLALGLFEDAKDEKEININSISLMSTVGEEKFAASTYIKEYFNSLKGANSQASIFASNTVNAPTETKGGILSTFRQKIRGFASREHLSEMLAYSDFDMRDIGKQKTAIFIIIHDEKTTYHALATIFIKQCYETLVDEAQKNGGKLQYRTNFILDEFANMPPLKDIDAMVTAARSRLIRFTFIIQNFGQLKDIYGEKAGTIKGNCSNTVYLISTELASLEELSKLAGDVKVKDDKDKNASRPLITITDLQKLKQFEVILFRLRKPPFRTKLVPDFKMEWGINRVKADLVEREMHPVLLFDLREYVKEEKRKKMYAAIDENNPMPPFQDNLMPQMPGMDRAPGVGMPGVGMNPFAGGMPTDEELDKMIKDIDAKIAALDAEEAAKKNGGNLELPKETKPVGDFNGGYNVYNTPKEELVVEPTPVIDQPIEVKEPVRVEDTKEVEETKEEEVKPKVVVDNESVIIDDKQVSDDEFFDDFFGDD